MQKDTNNYSNSEKVLFSTSFVAKAELKCDFGLLEKTLEELPALKKASYGSRLAYNIIELPNGVSNNAEICFERNTITYKAYFSEYRRIGYRKELLKFLSLLGYTKKLYQVDFSSIYGYIIEALHVEEIVPSLNQGCKSAEEKLVVVKRVNVELAQKLIGDDIEIAALRRRISNYEAFLSELAEAIEMKGGYTLENLMEKIGMQEKFAELRKSDAIQQRDSK
ncbi:MAG: hypothetical protein ACP5SJ_00630 [Candidatus Micrarchaeia archaeon]